VRDQSVGRAILVNPSAAGTPWPSPGTANLDVNEPRVLVEIPAGFTEMLVRDPALALAWRLHTRDIFRSYLARGYRAVDFFLTVEARRGHYLLARM
jgi:predicted GNAT superfamily acetyltransferase